MKLIDKDGSAVHLPWDAAQAALASGAYELHKIEGERGPDQPAAQSPAPGVLPADGRESQPEGAALSNLTPVGISDAGAPGLPKEPAAPPTAVVVPAKVAPAPAKPVDK